MQKTKRTWEVWIIRQVDKLENKIKEGERNNKPWDGYRTPPSNKRYCATLPMMWDFDHGVPIDRLRNPDEGNWQMGAALTPATAKALKRGTVIASFNRGASNPSGGTGLYENETGGNHAAIFLGYFEGRTGKWIRLIEQGPDFVPRIREIYFGGGWISSGYFHDATYYNVVKIANIPFYIPPKR
jgi:hypothetical protein